MNPVREAASQPMENSPNSQHAYEPEHSEIAVNGNSFSGRWHIIHCVRAMKRHNKQQTYYIKCQQRQFHNAHAANVVDLLGKPDVEMDESYISQTRLIPCSTALVGKILQNLPDNKALSMKRRGLVSENEDFYHVELKAI